MKFTCSQLTLTRALNTVSKAVSNKTTIPVLRGILIQAKDNKLTLTASDLDISIIREMPAEIEEEGSAVVPSKLFGDIVRKLPNEEIVIEDTAAGSLNMSTSSSDFSGFRLPCACSKMCFWLSQAVCSGGLCSDTGDAFRPCRQPLSL